MILTDFQTNRLTNEIDKDISSSWAIDFKFSVRDHIYDTYHGDLHSPDGLDWHITFDDPKYETLFTLKHPPVP